MKSKNVYRVMGVLLAILFWAGGLPGQPPLTPAPGEWFSRDDRGWYARERGITRYLIAAVEGDPALAIQEATRREGDREADFLRAVAYAQLGRRDSLLYYVEASLAKGLPVSRYQAGPRRLFGELYDDAAFRALLQQHGAGPLVHGPLLGDVTGEQARIWVRTDTVRALRVVASTAPDFTSVIATPPGRSREAEEYTARLSLQGLSPSTTYYYRLQMDGKMLDTTYSFRTAPERGRPGRFAVAFGGGAAFIPWHHDMWRRLDEHDLDAFLFLGDNVYIDYPERPYIQQYCYYRRQSERNFRNWVAGTPIYAVWDDHDFGKNDSYGGPDPDRPAWKRAVWRTFRHQWINPQYGGGAAQPGVWQRFAIADVDFFLLDSRYYREPSVVGDSLARPSMLGAAQLAWLREQLLASTATFKVVASPVPWSFEAKGPMEGRYDTWRGYAAERESLFNFLADNDIQGVVLLAADRHRSDHWIIERPGAYALHEFESSKLTNTHTHAVIEGSEFGYNRSCSFGKLIFDTTTADPEVIYEIWNIDNELVYRYRLPLKALKR